MTRVIIQMDGGYAKIIIKGHAGYGVRNNLPEGHDIVCASISVLGQTLVQRLMDMAETEEKKAIIYTLKCEPGEINVRILAKSRHKEELETTIRTIVRGMELIQERYPDYIKVGVLDLKKDI